MNAIVRLGTGTLRGTMNEDGAVARFLGIPYAAPPVAALRWRPPQAALPWAGERDATQFGPASLQPVIVAEDSYMYNSERHSDEGWQSEDCLYLNVYTGDLAPRDPAPVIVWFHTGGFNFGWSGGPIYNGSNLAAGGAVVVTVNYRLGRLGFLAHPALTAESTDASSGNYGIMDQIAALEWVRDNISAFGGDPDCVTIYGQSAGSCSASILMATPAAAGLFHRAIGSSGGAFGITSDSTPHFGACFQSLTAAEQSGDAYMRARGATAAEDMRALPARSLLDVDYSGHQPDFLETVYPIIDGHVVPANPFDLFRQRRYNDVPLITGSNADEGQGIHFFMDAKLFEDLNRGVMGDAFDDMLEVYPMNTPEETRTSSNYSGSDRVFTWQNWTWARLQATEGTQPVYYYHFSYNPPIPDNHYGEQKLSPRLGAAHFIELPYTWRNLECRDWPFSAVDRVLAHQMSSYWLNFARTGDPNGEGLPHWDKFTVENPKMMHFDAHSAMETAPPVHMEERMAFWDRTYGRKFEREREPS